MRKYIPRDLIIILSGLLLFLFSCTPESCLDKTESFLVASFYDDVTKNLLPPDSVTIYGQNMEDSKLYNKTLNVQPALLPLNASTVSCTYIIKINGITDTLEFRYSSYPHLISKECGYAFYHNLDTPIISTSNAIKYIYVNKRNITTINEENIRIFY